MDLKLADISLIAKLGQTIENIVSSGLKQIEESKLREIKNICRISDVYVNEAFKIVIHHLSQMHSEIRLSSLLIIKELFKRSHHFRELLIADFQCFSKLVLEIDPNTPLPPPSTALKQLKVLATKTIKEWYETYGETYKKLKIGFQYLKKSKVVDFEDMEARSAQERQRMQEKEAKLTAVRKEKLKVLKEEVTTEEIEIRDCLTQIENGLELLLPDEFAIKAPNGCEDPDSSDTCDFRAHGISNNATFSLVIDVQPFQIIEVNQHNRELIRCMQDQYRLLTGRWLPAVFKWNIISAKLGAEEKLQKSILDLKMKVELTIKKYQETNLASCKLHSDLDCSSDSDLETVPDLDSHEENLTDIFSTTDATVETKPESHGYLCRKRRRKNNERTLPLDIDSYATSLSSVPAPTFSRNTVESYWVQDPESGSSATIDLVSHPVELGEAFCPVKWSCRAQLPNGKLCLRKDRKKCPFHGLIVARDEQGRPKDPLTLRTPVKDAVPEWQDPALLAEIKAATGVDLTMPTRGKRLRKNPFPNLTDLKTLNNSSRSRLEKKVFKRRC
ncbi:UV-stimulated scaffold protein A-like [Daphnia carinata]|uniref:UV-stimulated scaffold protein A-like n=1 Tax=Daphnia carinata TaxID=120202 RepID=UPI00257C4CE3|nr:UV-stimulated scaffold protein A-like [Daphnia carinata]